MIMMRLRNNHTFHAVVIGDPDVVKTTFLPQYTSALHDRSEPHINQYELYVNNTEKVKVRLILYELNEDDSLTSAICEKADLFIVCFTDKDPESNVIDKWIPETEKYSTKFHSILANKTDLRFIDENDQTPNNTEENQTERMVFTYIMSCEEQTGFKTDCLDEALHPLVEEAVRLQNKRKREQCCYLCLMLSTCCYWLPIMHCCDKIRK